MPGSLQVKKIQEIYLLEDDNLDNLFITCGGFEERFLGVPQRIKGNFPDELILFKFSEKNEKREDMIKKMNRILDTNKNGKDYHLIQTERGRSVESVLKLHNYFREKNLYSKELSITVDITTFTKDLLLNLMFYITNSLQTSTLRLLYTIPARYASPQEGWLTSGIKGINIPPMFWNSWSPLKDNLLIIFLGYEEMRAWSLIDRFSPDLTWLFITNPGSRSEWDSYCEKYNKRLLSETRAKDRIPALDPEKVSEILANHVTKNISEKYNIFVSPLGTKPQLIGTLYFAMIHPDIPVNILTTTVVNYNVPYYSWGIGDTFEFFFPQKEE